MPAENPAEIKRSTSSADVRAMGPSVAMRYFFNLTDGDAVIRDEEGVKASSVQAAVISAMAAVEELFAEDPMTSAEWQGWRLEIVDASGQAVQVIPLEASSPH
jgi:hypothetical protein